jgi:transcriptional regulator with XRE-family HTH domain
MSRLLPFEAVLARALRRERLQKRIKLAVIAAELGVTPQAVNNWEMERRRPSPDLWVKWAVALGFRDATVELVRAA